MSAADFNFHRDEFIRLFFRTRAAEDLVDPEIAEDEFDLALLLDDVAFLAHVADLCSLAGVCQPERGQKLALLVSHLIAARLANGAA